MKKLIIIAIIAALSIFIFAPVASAGGNCWKNFHGVYEMSLKGNGLNSTAGFTDLGGGFFTPKDESVVWGSTDTAYGTFIFKRNGKGTASGWNYSFDLPPGPPFPPGNGPLARNNEFYIEFDYFITCEGEITVDVTFPPILTPVEMIGKVSQDFKTMTLGNFNSLLKFGTHDTLFTATRVLIWVKKPAEAD